MASEVCRHGGHGILSALHQVAAEGAVDVQVNEARRGNPLPVIEHARFGENLDLFPAADARHARAFDENDTLLDTLLRRVNRPGQDGHGGAHKGLLSVGIERVGISEHPSRRPMLPAGKPRAAIRLAPRAGLAGRRAFARPKRLEAPLRRRGYRAEYAPPLPSKYFSITSGEPGA